MINIKGAYAAQSSNSCPERFLVFLAAFPGYPPFCMGSSEVVPTPPCADWWVSLVISLNMAGSLLGVFRGVHVSVRSIIFFPKFQLKPGFPLSSVHGIVAAEFVESGAAPSWII